MPGVGCQFFRQGHCVYGEYENPGLAADALCQVLCRLERRFDCLLDRWDQAGVGLEAAARIWQSWVGRAVVWDCPDYVVDPQELTDVCIFFMQGLCLLRFPLCSGRCRHYEPDPGGKL